MHVERNVPFNDHNYKKMEWCWEYRNELFEMIGKWWFGCICAYLYKHMTYVNCPREIGTKSKGTSYTGEGNFTIEKLLRLIQSDSKINDGFGYELSPNYNKPQRRRMVICKTSFLNDEIDGEIKLYRAHEHVRNWIGNSWSDENGEVLKYFIGKADLRGKGGLLRNDELDDETKMYLDDEGVPYDTVVSGFISELTIDASKVIGRRKRGFFTEDEYILCKKDLNPKNVKIFKVVLDDSQKDFKTYEELDRSFITDNRLYNNDNYPSYAFD